ncbi:uncharacterized protein DS421_14g451490 [Arachis hypogaea]|nr:uncharacterized protein DS421_14g451490 [Arachis hypogaea]
MAARNRASLLPWSFAFVSLSSRSPHTATTTAATMKLQRGWRQGDGAGSNASLLCATSSPSMTPPSLARSFLHRWRLGSSGSDKPNSTAIARTASPTAVRRDAGAAVFSFLCFPHSRISLSFLSFFGFLLLGVNILKEREAIWL